MKNIMITVVLIFVIVLFAGNSMGQDSSSFQKTADKRVKDQALFILEKNNQQPFEAKKVFRFTVLQSENMNLSIFDLNGDMVCTLVSEQLEPGIHDFVWDGTDSNGNLVKSGVYRYCLKTQGDEQSHIIAYLR